MGCDTTYNVVLLLVLKGLVLSEVLLLLLEADVLLVGCVEIADDEKVEVDLDVVVDAVADCVVENVGDEDKSVVADVEVVDRNDDEDETAAVDDDELLLCGNAELDVLVVDDGVVCLEVGPRNDVGVAVITPVLLVVGTLLEVLGMLVDVGASTAVVVTKEVDVIMLLLVVVEAIDVVKPLEVTVTVEELLVAVGSVEVVKPLEVEVTIVEELLVSVLLLGVELEDA